MSTLSKFQPPEPTIGAAPPTGPSVKSTSLEVGYTAFADSPLWDLQRQYFSQKGLDAWAAGQVPQYVTSHPSMAKAYAQVVLGFWRDLKAQGMASSQPLYIVELGAGSGRFAYHFLLQFFSAFDAVRDPEDKVCYVIFAPVDQTNIASQRVLAKLGYQRLPFYINGERPGCCYYHFGQAASELELRGVLNKLLAELDDDPILSPLVGQELS